MNKNKILAVAFLMICIKGIFGLPVSALQTTAEVHLGAGITSDGFYKVESGHGAEPSIGQRDGAECWLMIPSEDEKNSYINFIFDDNFKAGVHNGSVYEFEIEYFDGGNGFILFEYDSEIRADEIGGVIYTGTENRWKTARFSVDDGFFYKRLNNQYDFRIGVKWEGVDSVFSQAIMAVRRVRVTRRVGANPVYVTASVDQPGNAFPWYQESKIIHNEYENVSSAEQSVSIRYRLIDSENQVWFDQRQTLTLGRGQRARIDLDVGQVTRCGIYRYIVNISDGGEIDSEFQPFSVAVLKTDPDGILNEGVLFAAHLEWYGDPEIQRQGVEMIKMSNSWGIRSNFDWNSMEPVRGTLDWNEHNMKTVVEAVRENGLHLLPILSGPSLLYTSAWNEMPKNAEQIEGWKRYAGYSAQILSDYGVHEYEVWNEPNLGSFNLHEDGGDTYAALVRASKEAIKAVDPTAKIGGPCVTGINGYWGRDYFTEAMEAGMGDDIDAITLHPYTQDAVDVTNMDQNIDWFLDEFSKYNGTKTPEIWNTEMGYSSAEDGIDERTKGALNSRAAILYKAKNLSDKTVFYNFEKKGIIKTDKEHQFGHVSPAAKRADKSGKSFVPTESFAMITGLNYVMARSRAETIIDSPDGNIRICQFYSDKFGVELLAIYAIKEAAQTTLFLGTDQITCYDAFGNDRNIYGEGGVYTFRVDQEPTYITGDFQRVEFAENNALIGFEPASLEAAEGEFLQITIQNYTGKEYSVEAKLPQNVTLVKNYGFTGGQGSLVLRNTAVLGDSGTVTIDILAGERLIASFDVKINTVFSGVESEFVQTYVSSSSQEHRFAADDTVEFDVRFGNTRDDTLQFTAQFAVYPASGDMPMKCSTRQYMLEPYGTAGDMLIIPHTDPGCYRLVTTIMINGSIVQSIETLFSKMDTLKENVFEIKGSIPSGQEGQQVSLVVFDRDGQYGIEGDYTGIYHDQQTTGITGSFNFKICVPVNRIKAYVVSEEGDVQEFLLSGNKEQTINVFFSDGLVKLTGFSLAEIRELRPQCVIEFKNIENPETYDVYCAAYAQGELISIIKEQGEIEPAALIYQIFDLGLEDEGPAIDCIKVMVWESGEYRPLCVPFMYTDNGKE